MLEACVQGPPQAVIIEHVRGDAVLHEKFNRLVSEELWREVQRTRGEAQRVDDHRLQRRAVADLATAARQETIYDTDQVDVVAYPCDDTQMVQTLRGEGRG